MQITPDVKIGYDDVLIRPKRSTLQSRAEVDLFRWLTCPHSGTTLHGIPIVAANMDTVGTAAMGKEMARWGCYTALHKHLSPSDIESVQLTENGSDGGVFVTVGTRTGTDVLSGLSAQYRQIICLDVANGYSEHVLTALSTLRSDHPNAFIMAGNVCTPEMTEAMILAGASCVKVGIGPGSACTTRVMTGVGYPQLSAVIECADAAHGLRGHICADGGCRVPGDIVKALAGGADLVMIGGMIAGTDEAGGTTFRGMSSAGAMHDRFGYVSEHRASEGKTVTVAEKGPVEGPLRQILGGIRSACTYVGAERVKDLPKCTTFVRTREQENQVFGSDFKWWLR